MAIPGTIPMLPPMRQRPDAIPYYTVSYSSVDGAGSYDERYANLADAVAFAQARTDEAAAVGSIGYQFNYRYRVLRQWPTGCRIDQMWPTFENWQ